MLQFIQANLATGIIILLLALCVFFAIRKIVMNKKSGKSSCGCDCAECPHCAGCKTKNDAKK